MQQLWKIEKKALATEKTPNDNVYIRTEPRKKVDLQKLQNARVFSILNGLNPIQNNSKNSESSIRRLYRELESIVRRKNRGTTDLAEYNAIVNEHDLTVASRAIVQYSDALSSFYDKTMKEKEEKKLVFGR